MALLRRWQPVRLATLAAPREAHRAGGTSCSPCSSRPSPTRVVADTWRPNYRIGPVLFNQPLGDEVQVISRKSGGRFAARPRGGGPVVRGILFEDPNSGQTGERGRSGPARRRSPSATCRSGIHWRTAKRLLPGRWTVKRLARCGWLNSSRLRDDRTGPVSTQLFFRRSTGRIYEIALNEITEIGCPEP